MNINLNSIIQASEDGGKIVKSYFGKALDIEEKTTVADFRTQANIESEKTILSVITKKFPQFNVLSEETGLIDNKSEYTFIIDPLDGSNNFVLGVPNFSISIGLLKGDRVILGVIHLPILNHTYYAQEGQGAFLDNKRLAVNKEADIKKTSISYTCGYVNSKEYTETLKHKL
jgi:myo-inositol-1(or 4)-monophosphatase